MSSHQQEYTGYGAAATYTPNDDPNTISPSCRHQTTEPHQEQQDASPQIGVVVVDIDQETRQKRVGDVLRPHFEEKSSKNQDIYIFDKFHYLRYIGLFIILAMICLFIYFGVDLSTNDLSGVNAGDFISTSIVLICGCVLSAFTARITLTFDKDTRQVTYNSSRFFWICFNKSVSLSFSDIIGFEHKAHCLNRIMRCEDEDCANSDEIIMRVASRNHPRNENGANDDDELVVIAAHLSSEAAAYVAGWNLYLNEEIRSSSSSN